MKNSILLFSLLNVYVVFGFNETSFYTPQEEETLSLCSEEYNTYINRTAFRLYGNLPDETHYQAKCLFFCVPQKLSITDDTGVIDNLQIKDLITSRHPSLNESVVKALVKKCTKRREADVCDRWYYLTKCIWNAYLNSKKGIRRRLHERRSGEEQK